METFDMDSYCNAWKKTLHIYNAISKGGFPAKKNSDVVCRRLLSAIAITGPRAQQFT